MLRNITIIVFIVFQIGNIFGQTTLIKVENLHSDIDSLKKYIEDTHPNAFLKYSKEKFNKDIENAKLAIVNPMSNLDFYVLLSSLLAKLEDGHTTIWFPQAEYFKLNPSMFPYNVKLSNKEPFIIVIKSFNVVKNEIPANAEIISINGIESSKIVEDIAELNSGETINFKLDIGANYFYFYLNKLYGMQNFYLIKYKFNKRIKTINIFGVNYESLITKKLDNTTKESILNVTDYFLKIIPESKTAIIDFVSFNNAKKFNSFIDSAFEQIKLNKVEHLIIDIRENKGGDSQIGDIFFQYISKKPYVQYKKYKIKYSSLQKEDYKIRFEMTKDSIWLKTTNKPNGLIEEDNINSTIVLKENNNRFDGKIFLLTGISTYSSAASFAQCFKNYKMGKVIGEETGGCIIHFGDVIVATLPNSKLNFTISHKIWYEIGAGENDFHGTTPDIEISSDKALDYTLDLIKKNN